MGGPLAYGLGEGLTTPHRKKKKTVYCEMLQRASENLDVDEKKILEWILGKYGGNE